MKNRKAVLKQTIGRKSLLLLSINAILGTGIFFLPALGAAYAGPASIFSWIIMSVIAALIALYFAELASMYPKSGGVYEYTKNAFGEFPSFVIGWIAWIVANITIAMLVVGSLYYILPNQGMLFNIIFSLAFILLFNFVSYRGIDVSTKLLAFFGAMTILSILSIVFPGFLNIDPGNFNLIYSFPLASVVLATYFISETFFGWETIGYLSEEVKNARKIIPKMILVSTAAVIVLSLLLVFVALGSVKWSTFGVQFAPLSFLAGVLYGNEFARIFALIVFIPLIGTAASWIVAAPRLLYAMSRDNVLVPRFRQIHKKYKTPHHAILFQALVSSAVTIVALGDFYLIVSLLLPLATIMYSAVMLSVVKLRIDKPRTKRAFKAPLGEIGPIAVTAFNVFLIYVWLTQVQNAFSIFLMGAILIMLGIPLYVLIKIQTDERFTEKFFDAVSLFYDRVFPVWYGKKDVSSVINRLHLTKKSIVLDFGCGSGITTIALARKSKLVVGVDISEKQLEHAIRRIASANMSNVVLIRESKLKFRKNSFDAVAAVGVLEYIDNPGKTMGKLIGLLKRGGYFSFLSFGTSLGIPAPAHLKNEKEIEKLFRGMRVSLHVEKERKKLTEYWHVWGQKK